MGYLSDQTQQRLAWLATGTAATLLLTGGAMVLSNPQMGSQEAITAAYNTGKLRQSYVVPQGQTGRLAGYFLAALGIPVGIVGALLADTQPRSIAPTPIPKDDGNGHLVITSEDLEAELQSRIQDLLYGNDWLRACLRSHAVILCGDMGSGKTTIAAAIALLRQLLWGWETVILDPHADDNLETWMNGKVFGSEKLASIQPDYQIAEAWNRYRKRSESPRTLVLDEFSSWGSEGDKTALGAITANVVKHGTADARKFQHYPIYLVHGEENGMMGGTHINSGWQRKLKDKAIGIRLVADYDDWGQPRFTGKAEFKPAGKAWEDANFQPFAIPALLKPGRLKQQLGAALEWLGIGIDPDPLGESLLDPKVKAAVDDLVADFNSPEFIERLEHLAAGPVVGHPIEGTESSEPTIDWNRLEEMPHANSLVAYLKRKKMIEVDPRKVQQNWGRHKGLKADDIQSLLDHLGTIGLGHWLTTEPGATQIWRLRVSPDHLPES